MHLHVCRIAEFSPPGVPPGPISVGLGVPKCRAHARACAAIKAKRDRTAYRGRLWVVKTIDAVYLFARPRLPRKTRGLQDIATVVSSPRRHRQYERIQSHVLTEVGQERPVQPSDQDSLRSRVLSSRGWHLPLTCLSFSEVACTECSKSCALRLAGALEPKI